MNRKDFIGYISALSIGGSLAAFLAACQKNNPSPSAPVVDFTLDLSNSSNAALLVSGGYLVSNQVMVINNSGSYVALSDICTHQGCSLGYNSSANHLECGCHGGVYSISGSVISGPPPASLKQYAVAKNGNSLHISG